jgi:hypothetical protein
MWFTSGSRSGYIPPLCLAGGAARTAGNEYALCYDDREMLRCSRLLTVAGIDKYIGRGWSMR